jgi:hypothetical protein
VEVFPNGLGGTTRTTDRFVSVSPVDDETSQRGDGGQQEEEAEESRYALGQKKAKATNGKGRGLGPGSSGQSKTPVNGADDDLSGDESGGSIVALDRPPNDTAASSAATSKAVKMNAKDRRAFWAAKGKAETEEGEVGENDEL